MGHGSCCYCDKCKEMHDDCKCNQIKPPEVLVPLKDYEELVKIKREHDKLLQVKNHVEDSILILSKMFLSTKEHFKDCDSYITTMIEALLAKIDLLKNALDACSQNKKDEELLK